MLTKSVLQKLAEQRMAEAEALAAASLWSGAFYLAGYAAELALKAVIAGRFVANAIPDRKLVNDVHTHRLEELVKLTGLQPSLESMQRQSIAFAANWEIVAKWREDARYQEWSEANARDMISALATSDDGVLGWIRANW